MVIDCESCELAKLACGDCVVSVLLGPIDVDVPVVTEVADEHVAAVAALVEAGLVPPLRHSARGVTGERTGERADRRDGVATVTPLHQRRAG